MTKLRAALPLLFIAASFAATPDTHAAVTYSAGPERVVEAGFHLSSTVDLTVRAVAEDNVEGTGVAAPTTTSSTEACITLTRRASTGPVEIVTRCGPAHMTMSPTLDTAAVTGTFGGYEFSLDFVANGDPEPVAEATTSSAGIGMSRAGTATAELIGDVFGEAEAQGSSWYAEAREKVKASANGQ